MLFSQTKEESLRTAGFLVVFRRTLNSTKGLIIEMRIATIPNTMDKAHFEVFTSHDTI
jgi:hypothetical protein